MSKSLITAGRERAKQWALAAIAAGLMYVGFDQIFSSLSYPLAGGIVAVINEIIRNNFHDTLALSDPNGFPWLFHAKFVASGFLTIVLGTFVGLCADAINRARQAP